jgi:O-antigen ligase
MRRRIILVNLAFIAMTLWILSMASSATSSLCLVLGALIITLAHTRTVKQRPAMLTGSIPIGVGVYLLLQFVLDVDLIAALAVAVGRDPDLTGRTNIWSVVLASGTNPLIGSGYESFWLGERLQWVWKRAGAVTEAHNGFLEVYLSLGLIGLVLYSLFLIASYRFIVRNVNASSVGSLNLALWAVLVFYNVTESALRGHLMWIAFLLGTIALPARASAHESARTRAPHAATRRPWWNTAKKGQQVRDRPQTSLEHTSEAQRRCWLGSRDALDTRG